MCGGYKKGENPSERGKNKIQWITNFTPAGLRGRVILGKGENMSELISRQQAVDALRKMQTYKLFSGDDMLLIDQAGAQTELMLLPPAQPEIIRCRNCKFASGDSRICMKFDHSPIGELDFCAWAERRTDEE